MPHDDYAVDSSAETGNGKLLVLKPPAIGNLISILRKRGYQVIAPALTDDAITFQSIEEINDLPIGYTTVQEAGTCRLKKCRGKAFFGYTVGSASLKNFLHPAKTRLFSSETTGDGFRIIGEPDTQQRFAFLGVRACELAALAIQDRVLLEGPEADSIYRALREGAFIVAVHCTKPAPTCFCASMNTGPRATTGFDIALTELIDSHRHVFLAESGTPAGAEFLTELETKEADDKLREEAGKAVAACASALSRSLDLSDLPDLLYDNFEHPAWDEVASRCLGCANCTMVCPTCFCTTVEDTTDIAGHAAERWRLWDSCFTQAFSYIHGGGIRQSLKSRYRQWLTHKFATWIGQFGTVGCVGCGRCITWCPVGIDVTAQVAALRRGSPASGENPPADSAKHREHSDPTGLRPSSASGG